MKAQQLERLQQVSNLLNEASALLEVIIEDQNRSADHLLMMSLISAHNGTRATLEAVHSVARKLAQR